ncbi:hypothetical protein Pcinc_036117 [Petrolisthes cinctipes]|uniref:Uncharacterized protein n=1 Tax=Petrolisthes cinctipes TaxID=88211 RepID=A0AAE1BYC8_PETCI|nr:hypothetical protein Pcinc_036117 [Petrolisthes cinctipes]
MGGSDRRAAPLVTSQVPGPSKERLLLPRGRAQRAAPEGASVAPNAAHSLSLHPTTSHFTLRFPTSPYSLSLHHPTTPSHISLVSPTPFNHTSLSLHTFYHNTSSSPANLPLRTFLILTHPSLSYPIPKLHQSLPSRPLPAFLSPEPHQSLPSSPLSFLPHFLPSFPPNLTNVSPFTPPSFPPNLTNLSPPTPFLPSFPPNLTSHSPRPLSFLPSPSMRYYLFVTLVIRGQELLLRQQNQSLSSRGPDGHVTGVRAPSSSSSIYSSSFRILPPGRHAKGVQSFSVCAWLL